MGFSINQLGIPWKSPVIGVGKSSKIWDFEDYLELRNDLMVIQWVNNGLTMVNSGMIMGCYPLVMTNSLLLKPWP